MNGNIKVMSWMFGLTVFLFILIAVVFSPFTIINSGYRGVVYLFGSVQEETLEEGFHFINPLAYVREVDMRTQVYEVRGAGAASKDLQSVSVSVALNYRLTDANLIPLVRNVGFDYEETIIVPAISESVKAATAQYTAEELITQRAAVKDAVTSSLRDRLAQSFLAVDSVSITNLEFSSSFNQAIEAKVTAEQEAQAAKNRLEQARYEAEQRVVQATAEAEAIRIQAEALAGNSQLVELEAVKKWNGVLPTYTGGPVPFLNLD